MMIPVLVVLRKSQKQYFNHMASEKSFDWTRAFGTETLKVHLKEFQQIQYPLFVAIH